MAHVGENLVNHINTSELPGELSHEKQDICTSENNMLSSQVKTPLLWLHNDSSFTQRKLNGVAKYFTRSVPSFAIYLTTIEEKFSRGHVISSIFASTFLLRSICQA